MLNDIRDMKHVVNSKKCPKGEAQAAADFFPRSRRSKPKPAAVSLLHAPLQR